MQVNAHFFWWPCEFSSLRRFGAYTPFFSIEVLLWMILLKKAEKTPWIFRLAHLEDERAIAVVYKNPRNVCSEVLNEGEGIAFAFSRYKKYSSVFLL